MYYYRVGVCAHASLSVYVHVLVSAGGLAMANHGRALCLWLAQMMCCLCCAYDANAFLLEAEASDCVSFEVFVKFIWENFSGSLTP